MKPLIYLLFFSSFIMSCESPNKELNKEQQAQKNLEEIRNYMIAKGLNPNDIEITDPAEAANIQSIDQVKSQIDNYLKERKVMESKIYRMTVLREKMAKAKTKEEMEKLVKEYPDLFITPNSNNVIRKN